MPSSLNDSDLRFRFNALVNDDTFSPLLAGILAPIACTNQFSFVKRYLRYFYCFLIRKNKPNNW